MSVPISFAINATDTRYYNVKDLLTAHPEKFIELGCKSLPRNIIVKANIPGTSYVYATYTAKTKEWALSTAECKKAQLLVERSWIDRHFYGNGVNTEDSSIERAISSTNEVIAIVAPPATIKPARTYKMAPPLLLLEDEEKFRDCDGNICEIETRGQKCRDKIYFKVSSVGEYLQLPSLDRDILNVSSGYVRDIHYITFVHVRLLNDESDVNKKGTNKSMYLTYRGLIRVLICSRSKHAEKFQDWAEKSLFTIQMGSVPEKEKLAAKLLVLDIKTVRAVLKTNASTFPCIYLLDLGTVKVLRTTFSIPAEYADDDHVYKYGFTDDFDRRLQEHHSKYNTLPNVVVKIAVFNIVDTKFTREAENEIKALCDGLNKSLKSGGYRELLVLDSKSLVQIKSMYGHVGTKYAGSTTEMQKQLQAKNEQIREQNERIVELANANSLLEKDLILSAKDLSLLQKDLHISNIEKQNNQNMFTATLNAALEKNALQLQIMELQYKSRN